MNIVCTFDDKYSQHCAAMLASLIHYNRNITIFCVSDYLSGTNREYIKDIVAKRTDCTINFIPISVDIFKSYPVGKKFEHLSLATYYRLLLPDILPENVHKVLYIDCDIIINACLQPLWDMDISTFAVAAVEDDPNNVKTGPLRLGYEQEHAYFNAGFLILNIDYLRKMNFTAKAFAYLNDNFNKITFHDQDVLNALLHDKKKLIDFQWNVMEFMFIQNAMEKYYEKSLLLRIRKDPFVIHFTAKRKPWYKECGHPYKAKYIHFVNTTQYAPFKETILYKGKEALIYNIKCVVKYFLDLLKIRPSRFINIKE